MIGPRLGEDLLIVHSMAGMHLVLVICLEEAECSMNVTVLYQVYFQSEEALEAISLWY